MLAARCQHIGTTLIVIQELLFNNRGIDNQGCLFNKQLIVCSF